MPTHYWLTDAWSKYVENAVVQHLGWGDHVWYELIRVALRSLVEIEDDQEIKDLCTKIWGRRGIDVVKAVRYLKLHKDSRVFED